MKTNSTTNIFCINTCY